MATPTANFGFLKPGTGESADITVLDTDLDQIDAKIYDPGTTSKLALGLVAEADMTTPSGSNTTLFVVMNIASFTFKANRRYCVEWHAEVANNTANTVEIAQIQTCSTSDAANLTTGLTEIRGISVLTPIANQNTPFLIRRHIQYGVDTTLQIKGTLNTQVGGGSFSAQAGATWPAQLTIFDEGKQF